MVGLRKLVLLLNSHCVLPQRPHSLLFSSLPNIPFIIIIVVACTLRRYTRPASRLSLRRIYKLTNASVSLSRAICTTSDTLGSTHHTTHLTASHSFSILQSAQTAIAIQSKATHAAYSTMRSFNLIIVLAFTALTSAGPIPQTPVPSLLALSAKTADTASPATQAATALSTTPTAAVTIVSKRSKPHPYHIPLPHTNSTH